MKYSILILIGSMLIFGCSSEPELKVVEITRLVPETVIVKEIETQIVVVTATSVPVTATPEFIKWTPDQVLSAFQNAGLEIGEPYLMQPTDYGPAPMVAAEGKRLLIPSMGVDFGGRVFSFASQNDLDTMYHYYEGLGKASGWFFSWLFMKDNILVQINGELPEDRARQYEIVLNSLN